jgi:hypothetical protein
MPDTTLVTYIRVATPDVPPPATMVHGAAHVIVTGHIGRALPPPAARWLDPTDATLEEYWCVDLPQLPEVLATVDVADARRLVVPLSWPFSPMVETALLLARLESRAFHVAVALTPDTAEAVFHYMTCLGVPWLAVPAPTVDRGQWDTILGRLARLWLFDPRSTVAVEPLVSALRRVADQLTGNTAAWCYRLLAAAPAAVTEVTGARPWHPALHCVLVAGLPERAAWIGTEWETDFLALARDLEPELPSFPPIDADGSPSGGVAAGAENAAAHGAARG